MVRTAPLVHQTGKYSIRCDRTRGFVDFSLSGFLTEEDGFEGYPHLADCWSSAREDHGRVLLLIDASKAQVQAPTLIAGLRQAYPLLATEDDRVALVVSSSLVRMQFRREASNKQASVEFFTSRGAAETWLFAND